MARENFLAAVGIGLMTVLAGCVAETTALPASASTSEPGKAGSMESEPGYVVGIVVDPELVPIPDVTVSAAPSDLLATTDALGAFKLGPLEPGTYDILPEKRGYKASAVKVKVTDEKAARLTLTVEPIAGDVPYHETLTRVMYILCHVVIANPATGQGFLNAPCGGVVDIAAGTTNSIDTWKFPFKIEKPGFMSLAMEMTWKTQQFGHDGLMQLTKFAQAEAGASGGVTVKDTVYGDAMAAPFHAIIHAGHSYWVTGGKNVTFYPTPNETQSFEMLVAGGGENSTIPHSAFFLDFRPTVYLTFFYNRQAAADFTILPDR